MANTIVFSSMKLIVDGGDPDTTWLQKAFKKSKKTETHGATTHIIRRDIIDNRFYWFYSNYGKEMPRPDNIFDTSSGQTINNPRKLQQVEPTRQLFAVYDDTSKRFYISQPQKKTFLEEFLSQIDNKEVIIKSVFKSVDEFADIIKALGTVEFSKTQTGPKTERDIFTVDQDALGYDEKTEFRITVKYGTPIRDGIRQRLRMINSYKDQGNIKNLIIKGKDDQGFETVFNTETFTSKIKISLNKDKQSLFPPDEVEQKIIARLME